jgi:hypothetical protein
MIMIMIVVVVVVVVGDVAVIAPPDAPAIAHDPRSRGERDPSGHRDAECDWMAVHRWG